MTYGEGCGESKEEGKQNTIEMVDEEEIPTAFTQATVFLSGWHMKYLDGDDHEIGQIEVILKDIERDGDLLSWKVVGTLRDHDFTEPYQLCYHYTFIAWNEASINAFVDHDEDGNYNYVTPFMCPPASGLFCGNVYETALTNLPSIMQNPNFVLGNGVAFLPRGFRFRWNRERTLGGQDDHDLLQIAYNHDHNEYLIKPAGIHTDTYRALAPSPPIPNRFVNYGYISWDTHAIFKDDEDRRAYEFAEAFSSIAGGGTSIIEPPFTIRPRENITASGTISGGKNGGNNDEGGGPIRTESFVAENVPFRYTVPLLTGWNLAFAREDEQVEEIGVWLHGVRYQKGPGDAVGTLRYQISSVLTDKDHKRDADHISEHNIDILGLDLVGPPDLTVERSFPATGGAVRVL